MKFREQRLGTQAVFLPPSLKLKKPASEGVSYESRLHAFLLDHVGGYTAQAVICSDTGAAKGPLTARRTRRVQRCVHGSYKARPLKSFLATLARDLREECVYLRFGDETSLIHPK